MIKNNDYYAIYTFLILLVIIDNKLFDLKVM